MNGDETVEVEDLAEPGFLAAREAMVEQILRNCEQTGVVISDAVLEIMRQVPRERFAPRAILTETYDDRAIPIGLGQTLSQPTMVAWMTTLLDLNGLENVLEVGTGSGYQAFVISQLVPHGKLTTIERHSLHGRRARRRLAALGGSNVIVIIGDGSAGYPDGAPFDRILVTAGAPDIPGPLVEQLASPGRLVCPVGPRDLQELTTVDKSADGHLSIMNHGRCVFVPLVGSLGWSEE